MKMFFEYPDFMQLLVNEARREQRLQKCRCDLQTPVKERQMKESHDVLLP